MFTFEYSPWSLQPKDKHERHLFKLFRTEDVKEQWGYYQIIIIAILVVAIVNVLVCPYPKYFIAFITVLISFTLQFGIWMLRNRLKDKIGAAITMVLICITFIFVLSTSFYLDF